MCMDAFKRVLDLPKLAVGELSVAVYSEETLSLSKMYHNFHELS